MNDMVMETAATTTLPQPRFLSVQHATELVCGLRHDHPTCAVVQMIAACNGEGTTALSWDLALVAAGQVGLRVLLVAVEPQGAFADPIYGAHAHATTETGTRRVGNTRLSIALLEPADLPSARAAHLQAWRKSFDLVLLDCPALARSSAGIMLAESVDTSLLVVAAESTRLDAVRELRDRLWDVGGQTKGVVLNKRPRRLPGFIARRL
jgi:Mrp family chromosome partitioning ATPase